MTPERWQQVDRLFQAALALEPADRAAFLDHACKTDAALRSEVESLIASHDRAGRFISAPAIAANPSLIANTADSILQRQIGPYRILSPLGAGGMGEVFLAHDTRLGRKVALKLLPDYFTRDEQRVRRFQQEARAASALNHPNIITIYEIGESEGRHFIVAEFVEGETLRQTMAKGRSSLTEAIDIGMQAAGALAAAHQAGIVHRDIKPENLMVRPDGLMKVLDFGLAKLVEGQAIATGTQSPTVARVDTDPGTVMGTAHYMSPEQARGLAVDARTDLFSLGVVVYEMVAGRTPFAGDTSSDVIAAILKMEAPPLSEHRPDAPPELQWIVSKALRKDRDERYQTAKDLLGDLKNVREEIQLQAKLERSLSPASSGKAAATTSSGEALAETTSKQAIETGAARVAHATSSAEHLTSEIKEHKTAVALTLAILLIAVAALVYFSVGKPKPIDSIAVLPFVNGSNDADAEYLSDGIAESLINSLSQLAKLRVVPRSTVFRYKGQAIDPQAVGRDLGVRAVLTGRVVQRGGTLNVQIELIDVASLSQLWGEQYNRKLSDILAVQQEISKEISEKLQLRLTGEEKRQLARSYTDNTEAYQLYLKGRYFWNKRTVAALTKGVEYFEQTTRLDPRYALAYSGLADAYVSLAINDGRQPPRDYLQKAKAAALQAIELDETLAEAHTSLGAVKEWFEWDWAAAESQYRRALELNPNYATAHHRYGVYLTFMRRLDEALAEFKHALEIEPLSLIINTDLAFVYSSMRDYDRAIEQVKKAIEIDPAYPRAHGILAGLYIDKGMYDEALTENQKMIEAQIEAQKGSDTQGLQGRPQLANIYAKQGRRAEALKILNELEELSKQRYVAPMTMARLYAALGDNDQAFAWVQKAYDERSPALITIATDPRGLLRSDPRVADLLRRAGFPLWDK
jgi:serine/threonine-protein kinase